MLTTIYRSPVDNAPVVINELCDTIVWANVALDGDAHAENAGCCVRIKASSYALLRQCLIRVAHYFVDQGQDVSAAAVQARAEWVITQIRPDPKLRPLDLPPQHDSGISDSYIDRIIQVASTECPVVTSLRLGAPEAWDKLLDFVYARVYTNLRKYNIQTLQRDVLVEDLTQSCIEKVYKELYRYRYDDVFDAWVSKVVANQIRAICFAQGFKRQASVLSFDHPMRDDNGQWIMIEPMAAQPDTEYLDPVRVVREHPAWRQLSIVQQDVCLRRARGESQRSISRALGKDPEQIHSIQARARKKFKAYARNW